jgi:MFS family permease
LPESGSVRLAAATSDDVPFAGARKALLLLLAINLLNYIDRYVLASVEPHVRAEFFSPDDPRAKFWMGLLSTAFLVTYMVTAPVFGWLADRTRRWTIVGCGVLLWSLASGGSGLAVTYIMLLITRVFIGLGEASYGPAAPTLLSDLYPVSRRGRTMAWFYSAIPVGSAFGYLLGGVVASHWNWRWAFYLSMPPGVLLGVLALFMPEPPRGMADHAANGKAIRLRDYWQLASIRTYVLNTLAMAAMTFAIGGIAFWMPTYISEYRGVGALGMVSTKFGAITVVAGLAGTLVGGWLGDRLQTRFRGAYMLVSGIGMLLAFPLFIAALYVPFPWAWWLILAVEFLVFLNTGPANTVIANVTPPAIRASAFAINIFLIHILGDAISPPMIGWVAGALRDASGRDDMNAGFLCVSAAILISGLIWIAAARYLEDDTARVSHRANEA